MKVTLTKRLVDDMLMHSVDRRLDYVLRPGSSERVHGEISQADQEERHHFIIGCNKT